MSSTTPDPHHPLRDITVLDVTDDLAGAFCTRLLAGLGAEVIKVESPGAGDGARGAGPFPGDQPDPERSASHLYLNAGKKSVTLDLETGAGASVLLRLAQQSDILVESFPIGYLDRLGLGYPALESVNPGLIFTSISPFGRTGPYRDYKGSDIVAQAMGALMYTVGLPDREPLKVGGRAALYTTGMSAFSAIMLALHVRDTQGHGQHVDVSAMETITVAQIHASIHHQFGRVRERTESTLVRAADGWVNPGLDVGVAQDTWSRVCELMGLPGLADDPAFNTREARREHQQDLLSIIGEWTASRPKEAVYHALQGLRTVAGYVATVEDMLGSEQFRSRGFFRSIEHPVAGKATYPGAPFTLDGVSWRHDRGPLLGEHNAEVLMRSAATRPRRAGRAAKGGSHPVPGGVEGLASSPAPGAALQGLRVLDLTQVAVGPYATLLLGYMGAQVIKVESLSRMDISRGQAKPAPGGYRVYPGDDPGERPWNRSGHHVHRNANKLSVTLDLTTRRGKELFLTLVTACDALVENFRASVMDRLGLGYGALREVNPLLVYLKISSQGMTGPERDYGSLGSTLEQTAGLASITGYDDGLPLTTNETYPDPAAGMLAVGALLVALRRRRKTGLGTLVDLSQREVTATLLGEAIVDYSLTGRVAGPMGNAHPIMAPHGVYRCQGGDMWLALSVGTDAEWSGLCRAIGRPELAQDPRFATAEGRRGDRRELDSLVADWARERDHYQAMHMLQAHGVPAGAVLKGGETIADPHLEARGFWDLVEHPEVGTYKQVSTPWRLSKNPRRSATPAPGLGEHNAYVLGELLGVPERELAELEEQGVIGTRPVGAD